MIASKGVDASIGEPLQPLAHSADKGKGVLSKLIPKRPSTLEIPSSHSGSIGSPVPYSVPVDWPLIAETTLAETGMASHMVEFSCVPRDSKDAVPMNLAE